ncbi:hypothetical protein OAB70_00470 [bacterium]|nr:hypothetical protein [bacterium]
MTPLLILIPCIFNQQLITKLPNIINWDKKNFTALLEMNCEAARRVASEIDGVTLIEFSDNDKEYFRDTDWIHFSKKGLEKMGENATVEFLKMYNLRKKE